ncbi:MAG TPA: glycosyltransferase family 1 protein [Steroidobacteraceae bacterium]|nr:glycosyltransferase family 1 protein [Steroidobacteraceae bacterium]
MRILIATDAWRPQTNGVVSTLEQTVRLLEGRGHDVRLLTPEGFSTIALPGYPEIRLAMGVQRRVSRRFSQFRPEAVHIATEGPIGLAVRAYCLRQRHGFTTSYHTQFPQYLRKRLPVPVAWSYGLMRWFHAAGRRCMVSTQSMQDELAARGFRNLVRWRRGVDSALFRPRDKSFLGLPRPIAAYVGRVAVEKNLEAFLSMEWQGSKLVIGDGPERAKLQARFPGAVFVGYQHGERLASHLAAADVMVFPSLTDTFGLVNLEALACGVPVAAFPVTGPKDVIEEGVTGALDWNLAAAARRALHARPSDCMAAAARWSWDRCTSEFESHLVPSGV